MKMNWSYLTLISVWCCIAKTAAFQTPCSSLRVSGNTCFRLRSKPIVWSSFVTDGINEVVDQINESKFPFGGLLDVLVHNPVFWSSSVMVTIVGLLLLWETFVEFAREKTPKAIIPVIDSMLVEMGSLGFIGIAISVLLNKIALGDTVGDLSEKFLGEREILLETFEFLHEAFFQVAILFFAAAGIIVIRILQKMNQIVTVAENQLGNVCVDTAENLARILNVYILPASCRTDAILSDSPPDLCSLDDYDATLHTRKVMKPPILRELTLTTEERGAEILTIRERLIQELDLPRTFRIDTYLENIFAQNKLEIVDLSPLTWLPLVPALALANALDLSHDVINADSPNAAETSGYFFSTPWVLYPSIAIQGLCLGWGTMNFCKMADIKSMLTPTLVRDAGDGNRIRMLPPAVENLFLRREFDSTPQLIKPIERIFRKEPKNINAELFGEVGAGGPEFYLNSIKFHTWLCVANIFFFSTQILPRDFYALLHEASVEVGDPDSLVPEILTYGALVVINVMQLYFSPTTLLNYCLITSVEDLKEEWAIEKSIEGWDGTPIKKQVHRDLVPSSVASSDAAF